MSAFTWKVSQVYGLLVSESACEFRFLRAEFAELLEALQKCDWEEAVEEWHDVAAFAQIYVYATVLNKRLDWKVPTWAGRPSFQKFAKRIRIWRRIFRSHDMKFDIKFLRNGGNYKKPSKIQAALQEGRKSR